MKTIVVGYDGSDAAERALARATELAEAFSGRLFVVSVNSFAHVPAPVSAFELGPPAVAGPIGPAGTVPVPEPPPPQEPEELARRQLERARMSLASRKVETEYLIELGDPAERLLEVADERDADLIVVGSREHGCSSDCFAAPSTKRSRGALSETSCSCTSAEWEPVSASAESPVPRSVQAGVSERGAESRVRQALEHVHERWARSPNREGFYRRGR